jgi:cobalt-zinc-cadmium efflux system membrane fusion protein
VNVRSALLLGSLALAAACTREPPRASPPAPFIATRGAVAIADPARVPVAFTTTVAALAPPLPAPPITGRVTTVETLSAPLYAPLVGRVAELRVRLGDRVKPGDRMVFVRSAELPNFEREVRAAELAVQTKAAFAARVKQLVDERAAPANDLTIADAELAEARLAVQAARSRLHSLAVDASEDDAYWVVATRRGTVVQLDAAPGTVVGPERDRPIATVADLDEVLVLGDLPQRDAVGLHAGVAVRVSYPGSTHEPVTGALEVVSEVVDPVRQTVPIRVRVPNTTRFLKPNAYVDLVLLPDGEAPSVQVPTSAVVSDGLDAVVFVESAPGELHRRRVELRRQTRARTEIVRGLAAGERVVYLGALLLLNAVKAEG